MFQGESEELSAENPSSPQKDLIRGAAGFTLLMIDPMMSLS